MKEVLIIGGGFAGISALSKLAKKRGTFNAALIDKKREFNFLPMLPDILGRKIRPGLLTNRLEVICNNSGAEFINEEAVSVDLEKKEVVVESRNLQYDYLIIACGSETNFYNNEAIRRNSFKLDGVDDANKILEALSGRELDTIVISGGGYTGIEIASNIRKHFSSLGIEKRIVIVEMAKKILGPLPDWMKDYVLANLKRLNIEVFTEAAIEKVEKNNITLSNKTLFGNAMLIWAAGVKTGNLIDGLNTEKNRQGRIKVDRYLRINSNCFVVGDAELLSYQGNDLRMAIQFAIAQGSHAAMNILNSESNQPLSEFRPRDLGYIIPMANNRSCGRVLGFNVRGVLPTSLHYCMCIYRTQGFKNKVGIIKDLIKGGAR